MSSFLGTDTYAIDHKGRIAVPASMRRGPTRKPLTTFVLNMGFDGCVAMYALDEWNRMMERLGKISKGNPDGRAFQRTFMLHARQVTVDAQGRIPIPPALMDHAGLRKEAVLHGANDHLEIWNSERFQTALAPVTKIEGKYEALAEKLFKDEA
ncbi:MAG TPA: division/cell wall cluster transcriptional repressor MraZ [Candidatus Limnocylindria bacterium]|nr:division/cell wall cluster transcriptional repressor MraZ [Candidatus Limnocylindria bacterium]